MATLHRAGLALALLLGLTLVPVATAAATPPGKNGPIAFRRYLGPDRTNGAIFAIAPDGTGERQLTLPPPGFSDDYPDVSPDGSLVAFQRCKASCGVYVVRIDGMAQRRVDHGCAPDEVPPGCVDYSYPAFSPDGRELVAMNIFGKISDDQIDHEGLTRMRLDGSHARIISLPPKRKAADQDPQWSPDGRRVVFVRKFYDAAGRQAVYTVGANGGPLRRVTPFALRAGDGPDWSPDGTRILFRSPETEDFSDSDIWTIRPDGSGLRQLTHAGPEDKVYSASFSPDGTAVTFGMTGVGGQADVWRIGVDGGAPTPVTRTPAWDSAPDWGPPAR
jgi:Tol biopolymer transport system component